MIFADKLISLRKRAGWSQEELANQLDVTRQSVSKWEGAQSIPDLDKIVQLSRLFGVTTDYLLKDELEEPESAPEDPTPARRRVSLEEATAYLACRQPIACALNRMRRSPPFWRRPSTAFCSIRMKTAISTATFW